MVNVSLGDRFARSATVGRRFAWIRLHPFAYLALAIVILAGLGYWVNSAIEDYHDRIALRGLDGEALPVRLIIAGEPVVVPANMLRFRKERRGGAVDQADFLLHWPSLEGYTDERADDFRDTSPDAPLIFITVSGRENSLDSDARLDAIYSRFFDGPEIAGPAGPDRPRLECGFGLWRRDRLLLAARRGAFRRALHRRCAPRNTGDLHPRRQYRPGAVPALPLQPEISGRLADDG